VNSAASNAGLNLKQGDVITAVSGKAVASTEQLIEIAIDRIWVNMSAVIAVSTSVDTAVTTEPSMVFAATSMIVRSTWERTNRRCRPSLMPGSSRAWRSPLWRRASAVGGRSVGRL
jgi:hypothetical protein